MNTYDFILGLLTGTCFGLWLYRTILDHMTKKESK